MGKTRKVREQLVVVEGGEEKGSRPFSLQFPLVFFFHVRSFSIQRTRLSRSLEQAIENVTITTKCTDYYKLREFYGDGLP